MAALEYENAGQLLRDYLSRAESAYLGGSRPQVPDKIARACEAIFSSKTQAYRETLLGCMVARMLDKGINIRQPYVDQGDQAFSGRTLDERVINPFLQSKQIPCSKGPYLSVFRRSIRFDETPRAGLRDKAAYDAFLEVLEYAASEKDDRSLGTLLKFLLYRFLLLREEAKIELAKLPRISLVQYRELLSGLLSTPSGGRIPVMLVVAMLETIKAGFGLSWSIEYGGINVADAAAGTTGDITVREQRRILMSLEVTERPVEGSRVQATFRTKIAPFEVLDYVFLVDASKVTPEALEEAQKYFAQGYDVNFVDTGTWLMTNLATLGTKGRRTYNELLTRSFEAQDVPKFLKVAWNTNVFKLAG